MSKKQQKESGSGKLLIVGALGLLAGGLLATFIGKKEGKKESQHTDTQGRPISIVDCPISGVRMIDPGVLPCGHSFQMNEVVKWLGRSPECPLCRTACRPQHVRPNYSLKEVLASQK